MATIGHLAAGVAVARIAGPPHPAPVTGFALLAAFPDVDLLLPIAHRGPTHSAAFVVSVAVSVWLVARLRGSHRAARLMAVSAVAVSSHLLLDLVTAEAPMTLLWPFSSTGYGLNVTPLPMIQLGPGLLTGGGLVMALGELSWSLVLVLIGLARRLG